MVAQTIEAMPRTTRTRTHTEHTDQPDGLTLEESRAYVRGYARGCMAYVKKNGAASVSLEGPAPAAGTPERRALGIQLAELTRAHEEERHPSAHRAGMAALRKYRKVHGIADPVAPKKTTRKPAARKLAAVPDVAPAAPEPVETAPKLRKRSRFTPCGRHAAYFGRLSLAETVRLCVEGGPAGATGCADGTCELLGGTDHLVADVCSSPYPLTWTAAPVDVAPLEQPAAPVVRLIPGPIPAEETSTPEESSDQDTEQTAPRTRKAARRALADAMRARGENPADPAAWAAAKLAAGIK